MKISAFLLFMTFTSFNAKSTPLIDVLINNNDGKKITSYTDIKAFYSPSEGPYIEIQLQLVSTSIIHSQTNNGLQGEIAIEYEIIEQGTNKAIKDAYRLYTPIIKDSIFDDFFELKRIALPHGNYTVKITLWDIASKNAGISGEYKITIPDFSNKTSISPIQIGESIRQTKETSIFSKSGYDIIPRIINYYDANSIHLPIYLEIYNLISDTITSFQLSQSIIDLNIQKPIANFSKTKIIRLNETITPFIQLLDISSLTTGAYQLKYTITSNGILHNSSTYIFEKQSNQLPNIEIENLVLDPELQNSISSDSLIFFLKSLIPISLQAEQSRIRSIIKEYSKKEEENKKIRKYIQAFWVKSSDSKQAYQSWIKYKSQVLLVENLYKTNFSHGFENDRGRVYLQYGAPSMIVTRETSPSEYPYEIWQYDKISKYSNKRFVFYNPNLVNNTYSLIHSDMIGELKNYRWQNVLTKRNSPTQDIDDPNDGNINHFGGESQDVFKQF
jgi:GWxTD domain-containing protein